MVLTKLTFEQLEAEMNEPIVEQQVNTRLFKIFRLYMDIKVRRTFTTEENRRLLEYVLGIQHRFLTPALSASRLVSRRSEGYSFFGFNNIVLPKHYEEMSNRIFVLVSAIIDSKNISIESAKIICQLAATATPIHKGGYAYYKNYVSKLCRNRFLKDEILMTIIEETRGREDADSLLSQIAQKRRLSPLGVKLILESNNDYAKYYLLRNSNFVDQQVIHSFATSKNGYLRRAVALHPSTSDEMIAKMYLEEKSYNKVRGILEERMWEVTRRSKHFQSLQFVSLSKDEIDLVVRKKINRMIARKIVAEREAGLAFN